MPGALAIQQESARQEGEPFKTPELRLDAEASGKVPRSAIERQLVPGTM